MKIIYCGFGRAGLECFYQLIGGFNILSSDILVFTHKSEENESFIKHLENNKIKYSYENINKHNKEIIEFKPDYLISVYYRFIIKQNILEVVNNKAMNLHPSLLPSYRGTKSSVWAILNNEQITGITFHYMNEKIDDGKIILQKKISINSEDTAYSLYHKLIGVFSSNFNEALQLLIDNYKGSDQIGTISYYPRELPFNGIKKFSDTTFQEAEQFIKAMFYPPFKGAMFEKEDGTYIEILSIHDLLDYIDLIGKSK